ncbi:ABC transporter permease [Lachnotalea sp. AF33-28]|uniref:ABC transporter permease n=1 Tax=Lachnotalea sp. AF33-28 TaxID=2292046 RepID=UPI000E496C84|nr:ABC transporter permease [Lachnotalea sp. AF33-28]RHP35527.1 ABC transporter permease [Lachnotalea sp. AF33-28]
MSSRRVMAVFRKQLKDTLKNKEVLIQFLMFPVLSVIMSNAMTVPDMPANFFVHMFATMYVGMAPLTCMSAVIAEEKEKNTLRVLMMSNVRGTEYLLGLGAYVLAVCMAGSFIFGLQGGYRGLELAGFMGIMFCGILTSTVIGGVIGIGSRNQMAATSVTVPVMMIFSFLPMIAMFNRPVALVSRWIYTQQINDLISKSAAGWQSFAVIAVNALAGITAFAVIYKKRGLLF